MRGSQPIRSADKVFLGNSLTEGFELEKHFGRKDLRNRGISGDTAYGVLHRLHEIIEAKPNSVFLMIGINDLLQGLNFEQVYNEIKQICNRLSKEIPETQLYLQSLLPVNEDYLLIEESINTRIYELNDLLKTYVMKSGLQFVDLHAEFLNHRGGMKSQYTYDGVHLSIEGYKLWATLIEKYL